MSDRIYLQTANCIVCRKPATQWYGHVIVKAARGIKCGARTIGNVAIVSGFCGSEECTAAAQADADGCHGEWYAEMGIVIDQP